MKPGISMRIGYPKALLLAAACAGLAGAQPARTAAASGPAAAKHLHLVFKVDKAGNAELLRAVEINGPALITQGAGSFVSEVARDDEPIAVQSAIDPFEKRSFPGKSSQGQSGHHFETVETAEVVVKIPGAGVADDLRRMSVRFYKMDAATGGRGMDKQAFKDLKASKRMVPMAEMFGDRLQWEIRAKAAARSR